jgi:alpha,alpha-trehalase
MATDASGLDWSALKAVLFDLDGVVTRTARIHARAWQQLFDEFLASRKAAPEERLAPFRLPDDYLAYIDGKPRYEGVQSFLLARGIDLPWGERDDPPEAATVCGLGNRKNQIFRRLLEEQAVEVFESSVGLIRALRSHGIRTACVSSSKNATAVLARADLADLFDVVFDGRDLERERLRGKPHPDTYLRAAARLGVAPPEAAVVEDAVAGVAAGRAGSFGLVIGVDRDDGRAALAAAGAYIVVGDLGELPLPGSGGA